MNKYIKYSLLILGLALMVRIPGLKNPEKITFDEVAGMTYSLHVLYHKPYFDVHPPLVDLIYTGWMHLGAKPEFQNKILNNDHNFGDFPYLLLRTMTALGGALIPLLTALIGWKYFKHEIAGLVAGLAASLDNALIVYSRLMLPDIWLILFGLAAWAIALKDNKSWTEMFGMGVFLGATVAVKWTGLGFWVIVIGNLLIRKSYKPVIISTITAGLFYLAVWIIFFSVIGTGTAFSGIAPISGKISYPGNNLTNIITFLPWHHLAMLDVNRLLLNHESASSPIQWIWGQKKIILFTDMNRTIILQGNLIGWWSMPAAVVCAILLARKNKKMILLIFGFLINILPFFFIKRIFFIYHYLPALTVGYILLGGVICRFETRWIKSWILLYVMGFIALSPITYGWSFPGWWVKFLAN